MPSVFLSYCRTDLEQATRIEQELTSRGIDVWRDQEKLRSGQRWPKALGEAIVASDALLLLWSNDAASSSFVELEWTTAIALRKQILPCLLDHTPLPATLAAVQTIQVADVAAEVANAVSSQQASANSQADTKQVIDKLAGIRATKPSEVLQQFQAPKSALEKWQAWVAIVAGLLTAVSLAVGLWHNAAVTPVAPAATPAVANAIQQQSFAGSIWNEKNSPIKGVKVSVLLDEKILAAGVTDDLGHFTFKLTAAPDAEITLIAQKEGFQAEKRYTRLGNTNFNFTMTGESK